MPIDLDLWKIDESGRSLAYFSKTKHFFKSALTQSTIISFNN